MEQEKKKKNYRLFFKSIRPYNVAVQAPQIAYNEPFLSSTHPAAI